MDYDLLDDLESVEVVVSRKIIIKAKEVPEEVKPLSVRDQIEDLLDKTDAEWKRMQRSLQSFDPHGFFERDIDRMIMRKTNKEYIDFLIAEPLDKYIVEDTGVFNLKSINEAMKLLESVSDIGEKCIDIPEKGMTVSQFFKNLLEF